MSPLAKLACVRHPDLPDVENPANPHLSPSIRHKQPAPEIPTWRRWLVVLGAFLALFCTFGHLSSFGTYLSWYRHNQLSSYSPSTIAWIGSLQLWVFFFSVSPSVGSAAVYLRHSARGRPRDGVSTATAHDYYSSPVPLSTYQAW